MLKNYRKNGFTLLELLVVVLIIGILAGIALPQYQKAVYKSRYNSLMVLTNAIYEAEESYYLVHDTYTQDLTALDIDLSGCEISNDKNICTFDWGVCALFFATGSGAIGDGVICSRTAGLQNAYVYYFTLTPNGANGGTEKRRCFAKGIDKNNIWNQICTGAGAKFWTSGSTSLLGEVNMYKF